MLLNILQGIFIGLAIILPGLSAGTVILILGFYRQFLDDLASLHFKPYLAMFGGVLFGALSGVYAISYLLMRFETVVFAFLLGMLLASIPAVVGPLNRSILKPWPIGFFLIGFLVTWFFLCNPAQTFTVLPPGGYFHFFLGGTLASATMLLPGVSGSAILIIMNLYDDAIHAITHWQWVRLFFLALGFVFGLFGFARLLSALYRRYQTIICLFLAGLILGSTRALMPENFSLFSAVALIGGALFVLYISRHRHSRLD